MSSIEAMAKGQDLETAQTAPSRVASKNRWLSTIDRRPLTHSGPRPLTLDSRLFVCCVLFLIGELVTLTSAAERPPNVLMIVSDDQAWSDYGFMEHPLIHTPNLDRLAADSRLYTHGYVPTSLCRPSLMTMITGLYPHQHRVVGNDPPKGTDRIAMLKHVRRLPTLPKLLAARGYLCLQTGKWWEGNFREGGFTDGMTHGDRQRGGRHGDEGLDIGRKGLQPIYDFVHSCGEKEKPFFIWYAPMLPHSPHTPPPRLLDKYKDRVPALHVARYYAMCEWFDETCGQLLDFLDNKALRENTLVVYVTDNGWIQDSEKPQFAPRSKRSPYDGGVRTPVMLRWPGKIQPKRDEITWISSIDLAPTILAACGVKPLSDMPGRDLLHEIVEKSPRNALFGEIFEHDVADIDDPQPSLLFRWCVADGWKIILPQGGGKPELYRIGADPWEQDNVAADHPDIVTKLTNRIDAWWPVSSGTKTDER